MCLETSQSLNPNYSKFVIILILFSSIAMDNQNNINTRIVSNIQKQQPVNTVETINPKPTLDQRIQTMKSMTSQTKKTTPSLLQLAHSTFRKSTCQQSSNAQTSLPFSPQPKKSNSLQLTKEYKLPMLQLPKKFTFSFIERFKAQHNNHQNPEYYKVATIPCGHNTNKSIPINRFTDEKWAYDYKLLNR